MTIHPSNRTECFEFIESGCEYLDHFGRRVLCDVEGSGTFAVTANCSVKIEVDDHASQTTCGEFSHSLLVTSSEFGEVSSRVLFGQAPGATDRAVNLQGRVCGAGWVVSADCAVSLDGSHSRSTQPTVGFPVPFFERAECEGQMSVVGSDAPAIRLDRFDIADKNGLTSRCWVVQNMSDVGILDSVFEDGTLHVGPIASHLNTARWTTSVPPANEGLIIRRTYDQFHGRQRARILVNDVFAGWWYVAKQDRTHRWCTSTFGIDASITRGVETVEIAVDPPAGSPLWSVSSYELLALIRAPEQ